MLQNGMGGIDWSGLPAAVEFHGVNDVEALIDALMIIKGHEKPKTEGERDGTRDTVD